MPARPKKKAVKKKVPEMSEGGKAQVQVIQNRINALNTDRSVYSQVMNMPLLGALDLTSSLGCRVKLVAGAGYVFEYPVEGKDPLVVVANAKKARTELLREIGIRDDAIREAQAEMAKLK